jgi:hypothetical protein
MKNKPDLTPFIEASKRGCKWFHIGKPDGKAFFVNNLACAGLPFDDPDFNHIAAEPVAFPAELDSAEFRTAWDSWEKQRKQLLAEDMIDLLRQFKREYGA